MLDAIDHALIARLQEDGRLGVAELGQAVGLSPSAANERVRKLMAKGAIRAVVALADPAALGLGITGFVTVTLVHGADEAVFVAAIQADPSVQECHHVTGAANYLLKVRLADVAGLEALLKRLKATGVVARTETMLALSTPKETTALPVGAVP
ncbi:Lrp/AsnC family transcriptional regulator [Oleomonas cavernae]|uniref:Lrp/AsnC family transcriptional regulator n=1 Tax=Oleomonas cavernae TaxID=2320859 RepID=A0A418VTM3_9PROT|nr:Lrp/AsnC family transcriptional regulator [Oleomonas cavernae]RJF80490.1 Lrp/AsnC family transcriptional regulator [Oleomonas cavernae]